MSRKISDFQGWFFFSFFGWHTPRHRHMRCWWLFDEFFVSMLSDIFFGIIMQPLVHCLLEFIIIIFQIYYMTRQTIVEDKNFDKILVWYLERAEWVRSLTEKSYNTKKAASDLKGKIKKCHKIFLMIRRTKACDPSSVWHGWVSEN